MLACKSQQSKFGLDCCCFLWQAEGRLYVADAAYSAKKATMDVKTAKAKQLIAEAEMMQAASEGLVPGTGQLDVPAPPSASGVGSAG